MAALSKKVNGVRGKEFAGFGFSCSMLTFDWFGNTQSGGVDEYKRWRD